MRTCVQMLKDGAPEELGREQGKQVVQWKQPMHIQVAATDWELCPTKVALRVGPGPEAPRSR